MSEEKPKQTKTYLFHHISSYLPLLEGEEFDAFVEDIKEFGQVEEAILYDGKILDGRNRYRACKKLGIELKVREWKPSEATGITPLQFVVSTNIMRRHLNLVQRSEIAILLEKEEKKLADDRLEQLRKEKVKLMNLQKESEKKNDSSLEGSMELTRKKIEELSANERTKDIVAKKVRISGTTFLRARKIKEIAETEPLIAEDWEKAKREEIGIREVYEKAQVVEEAQNLPLKQKTEVMEELKKGRVSAKQLQKILQDKKDDAKRLELAKKTRELQKRKQTMDKLRMQINSFEKKIFSLESAIKECESKLKVLTEEASKKYPKFASNDPDFVLTKLSTHYDTLDMATFDSKIADLKKEYNKLMQPLRDELQRLENEFGKKKEVIDKEKDKVSKEATWIEKMQDAMLLESNKIETYNNTIKENNEELTKLRKRFDDEFKDL